MEPLGFKQGIDSTLFFVPNFKDMTTQEAPHIGHLIKEELARQGRTVTWLAAQLKCSRQNVYGIFENQWIYSDTLLKISDALDYDFFKCYSDYRNEKKTTSNT